MRFKASSLSIPSLFIMRRSLSSLSEITEIILVQSLSAFRRGRREAGDNGEGIQSLDISNLKYVVQAEGAVEMAMLDLLGKFMGLPMCALLANGQQRDRVRFLGSQENVYLYLHDADVFVLPSRYEGMPMTVIEAMGTGLPIVASNVGGIPDMVKDGESGLLTTLAPEEIARCCAALLRDEKLRERLGRGARAESGRFSAEEMARSYCRVYES